MRGGCWARGDPEGWRRRMAGDGDVVVGGGERFGRWAACICSRGASTCWKLPLEGGWLASLITM